MANKTYNYKVALWTVGFVIICKLIFMAIAYVSILNISSMSRTKLSFSWMYSFRNIFFYFLFIVDFVLYYVLRKRVLELSYVRVHLIALVFSSVVLPLLMMFISFVLIAGLYESVGYQNFLKINKAVHFLSLGILILGHVFFFLAIRKSFTSPKEKDRQDEPPGFLNEFAE